MNSLDAIFSPESVAIIGASNTPGKVGHDIFANILHGGFQGTLYPVNPKAKSILSVKTFPTITGIIRQGRSVHHHPAAQTLRQGGGGIHRQGGQGNRDRLRRFPRGRRRGAGDRKPDRLPLQGGEGPPRRPQLPRRDQSRSRRQPERELLPADARLRKHLFHLPERGALHRRPRFCRGPGFRLLEVHLHRQQGGRGRAGSAPLPPQRPEYGGHHPLPRGAPQGAGIHRSGQGDHLRPPPHAGHRHQVGTNQRRRPGGRLPHRRPRRNGGGLRRHLQTGGDHPGRLHRRALRFCQCLCLQARERPRQGEAEDPQREKGGHRDQRRRSGDPGDRHDRLLRSGTGEIQAGDDRRAGEPPPHDGQHPQPRGRHRGRPFGPLRKRPLPP